MKITLHLGAHRTATSVFQNYLRENQAELRRRGIGAWLPPRTRDGLLRGVFAVPGTPDTPEEQFCRARGRIQLNLFKAERQGLEHLLISEENLLGAPRRNLRDSRIYRGVGNRVARVAQAFDGRIDQVVLSIRSQECYWASVIAYAVGRGQRVPRSDDLDRLVTSGRYWRNVIEDVAAAVPRAQILVLPYEIHGGRPEHKLAVMTGLNCPPLTAAREWMNRAPSLPQLRQVLRDRGADPQALPEGEGRWHPFDPMQTSMLREAYADDLFWLRAGADGLATLIEETRPEQMGQTPREALTTRGQQDGTEIRRLA